MSVKMLREHLCADFARWSLEWPAEVSDSVVDLIATIDRHRPLGSDGKHGSLHTPTCGCEDKPGTPW